MKFNHVSHGLGNQKGQTALYFSTRFGFKLITDAQKMGVLFHKYCLPYFFGDFPHDSKKNRNIPDERFQRCQNRSRFKTMSFRDTFFLLAAIGCFDLLVLSRAAFAARARSNCLFGMVSFDLAGCGVTTARVFLAGSLLLLAIFLLATFVLSLAGVSVSRSFLLSLLFITTNVRKSTTIPMSMNKASSSGSCPSPPDVNRMPDVSITIGVGGGL